jgi:hypothetical protein
LIRKWQEDFVLLADGNPDFEKALRKMDIFSFLGRILVLRKKELSQNNLESEEPFGRN